MTAQSKVFANDYLPIVDVELQGRRHLIEKDPSGACRFCQGSPPTVTFSNRAHAVAELLGNRAVLSPNECDSCNGDFGRSLEDQLGKALAFERAVSGMRGKKGVPTFKDSDKLKFRFSAGQQEIIVTDPKLVQELPGKTGPFDFDLQLDTDTPPFVPLRAAMALVKAACSLCPKELLPHTGPTIDWLKGRNHLKCDAFPVYHVFTPGDNPYGSGRAMLLKRVTNAATPFLCGVVASTNHRLQFFVPFCTEDPDWSSCERALTEDAHLPLWIDGKDSEFQVWNWASEKVHGKSFNVKLHIENGQVIS